MTKSFLFQGVTEDNHLDAVRYLLAIPHPERIIFSVAFMNERGLAALEEALCRVAEITTIVAGIRNGITSVQGLIKSLEIGCTTYAVDSGSRDVIFHPKVYVSRNSREARIIVGSANLTVGGINSNIEASLCLEMDLSKTSNAEFVDDLESKIDGMIEEYPEHVLPIIDNAMIESLFESGRVVDESIRRAPKTAATLRRHGMDMVPRMNLKNRLLDWHRPRPVASESVGTPTTQTQITESDRAQARERFNLVWQSKPLLRRHLTIPTHPGTNQTGSMLFVKGALEDIDQRHYFREEVFGDLDWRFDSSERTRHIERAVARFRIVIRDVNYGVYSLKLSHNSRTDTKSYQQHNGVTHLHWGEARNIIAQEDLLLRTMYLYRDAVGEDLFVLEID